MEPTLRKARNEVTIEMPIAAYTLAQYPVLGGVAIGTKTLPRSQHVSRAEYSAEGGAHALIVGLLR
jgi:hypothetical protein